MKPAAPVASVDAQNPWLGLVSFTEETRGYFHGREEESAELCRRVQRKLLTVLFGQSGLGKTSILQAGVVPRLRPEGFCPVYIRLDYNPYAPSPSDQIKRAMFKETASAGTWTKSGSAIEGETLWEFLHHRDDVLKDASGRVLTPILIFDQFEEIFTLAQTDDAGRRRAQEFLADLADLVENRPPASLEARIDRDEADAARFDFARADYRVLISLREDYLAHLEGLKALMPSVTQNRMRLARMTGQQAVSAVRAPAPALVSEPVAEAIVRFVSGASDLATAEVEPSLLSLICRELNNTRLAKGHEEISADLLAGSRDTILSEFYERALTDLPHGVRVFIEDEMLTDSGFRESVAEERVRKGFAAAGAPAGALATLVDRRLLRVEDRLDLRRVEITHDVLCSVIAASRGVRHEREALEESQRQLALQKEREAATQRALLRAKIVAAVSVTLMLVAVASAVFGWINLKRARTAEKRAETAEALTEKARGDAEKLVAFLLDDFYEELRPTGRVEIVGELAQRAVNYYDGLPAELTTNQTRLYRAMALVRKASALNLTGRIAEADKAAKEAQGILERLRKEGDTSETSALGLSLALFTQSVGSVASISREQFEEAVNLLRPFVRAGGASNSTQLTLADELQYLAHEVGPVEGIPLCEESRSILAKDGALDLSNLMAASIYGDVTDTESRLEFALGHLDKAEALAQTVGDIANKVLEKRPGDLRAMSDRYLSPNVLAFVAQARDNYPAAERYNRASFEAAAKYKAFDPADSLPHIAMVDSGTNLALSLGEQGKVSEALNQVYSTLRFLNDAHDPTNSAGDAYFPWLLAAQIQAQLGHVKETTEALEGIHGLTIAAHQQGPSSQAFAELAEICEETTRLELSAIKGDYQTIRQRVQVLEERTRKVTPNNNQTRRIRIEQMRACRTLALEAALHLNRSEEAISLARDVVDHPLEDSRVEDDPSYIENSRTLNHVRLAQALVQAHHLDEARKEAALALDVYRRRQAAGADGTTFRTDLGRTLYVNALAQPDDADGQARRGQLLGEAMSVLSGLSQEAQQLRDSKEVIAEVSDALNGH